MPNERPFTTRSHPEKVKEMMIHGTSSKAKKRCVALSKRMSERAEGDKGVDGGSELVEGQEASRGADDPKEEKEMKKEGSSSKARKLRVPLEKT